jgi:hypothetical protein
MESPRETSPGVNSDPTVFISGRLLRNRRLAGVPGGYWQITANARAGRLMDRILV